MLLIQSNDIAISVEMAKANKIVSSFVKTLIANPEMAGEIKNSERLISEVVHFKMRNNEAILH